MFTSGLLMGTMIIKYNEAYELYHKAISSHRFERCMLCNSIFISEVEIAGKSAGLCWDWYSQAKCYNKFYYWVSLYTGKNMGTFGHSVLVWLSIYVRVWLANKAP